jgi:hypothetical protein
VHIQLEVVQLKFSNLGWTTTGQPQLKQDMQKRPQELEISGPDGKRRTSFHSMKFGLFSVGSEEGFLVGEGGVVPWLLCRTPGSKVKLQITKAEQQLPVTTIQDPFLSTFLEQERYLRFLRQRSLCRQKRTSSLRMMEHELLVPLSPNISRILSIEANHMDHSRRRNNQQLLPNLTMRVLCD